MPEKYFDATGKEIKAGMTVYIGNRHSGACIPIVQHEGRLFFEGGWGIGDVSLDDVDLSDAVIEYDPGED